MVWSAFIWVINPIKVDKFEYAFFTPNLILIKSWDACEIQEYLWKDSRANDKSTMFTMWQKLLAENLSQ